MFGTVFMRRGLALAALGMLLGGCSVYMSADRQSYKGDPSIIQTGAKRADIEAALGAPDSMIPMPEGRSRVVYKIDPKATDKAVKAGATGFNLAADVVTLGLWEVIAFPAELASKDDITNYLITYDKEGKVESVESYK